NIEPTENKLNYQPFDNQISNNYNVNYKSPLHSIEHSGTLLASEFGSSPLKRGHLEASSQDTEFIQSINYDNKIQRLNKIIDEKDDEIRNLNMKLMKTKDELFQLENKQRTQETNFDTIKSSMQLEMDKLKHWLEIYENRKLAIKPHYKEAINELELKLHEQEMFYRKQIKDIDSEIKRKNYRPYRTPDDSGFFSDTTLSGDYHYLKSSTSPTVDYFNSNDHLRDQIQTIFRQHVDELDKCNSKYKTNLSNLKNRLHELENTTTEPIL
ncbi:unnamed protein product, partial [Didymodactylos carnosus]